MKFPAMYAFKNCKLITYRRVKDINYLRGDGNCTQFYFKDNTHCTESGSIGTHMKQLSFSGRFFRLSRSLAVNLCAIYQIQSDCTVVLKDGSQLHCAKKRLHELLKCFPTG